MPNHSLNWVHFAGPKAALERLAAKLCADSSVFDFQNVLPVPKELEALTNSRFVSHLPDCQATYRKIILNDTENRSAEFRDGTLVYTPLNEEEILKLTKNYGCTDSYRWRIANWGTKWNAYSVEAQGIDDRDGHSVLMYHFLTAWAPPIPVLRKIVDLFPEIEVFLYAEMEGATKPVTVTIPEVTRYSVDPAPRRVPKRLEQPRFDESTVSDADLYGTYLEHAMQSSARRPFQVSFHTPSSPGATSLGCLLESWSLGGPSTCAEIEPGIPLFLEKWDRVPSLCHLGKELRKVCGDPHLFGYVSKSLGIRRISTFMLNRRAWGFLVEAAERTLKGEMTYVPFEVARFVNRLENWFNLCSGDAVKFSFANGEFGGGALILARGWRNMPLSESQHTEIAVINPQGLSAETE